MNWITFEKLKSMDDNDKVFVCRIALNNRLAKSYITEEDPNSEASLKLFEAHQALTNADDEKGSPVFGIAMQVKDVLTIFSEEDIKKTSVYLPMSANKENTSKCLHIKALRKKEQQRAILHEDNDSLKETSIYSEKEYTEPSQKVIANTDTEEVFAK